MLDGRDWRGDSPDFPESRRPPSGGARQAGGQASALDGFDSLRAGAMLRWMGAMSTRTAALALIAAALAGVVLTLITGHDPGFILGFFVTIGAIVATLGVRRGAIYLFFPLPALILFLSSITVGAVHDRAVESASASGFGASFLQWVAAAFFPMCIATVVTLVIGGARWALGRQLITGSFTMPPAPGPASSRQVPGARRPTASDPWTDDAPRSARPPLGGSDRIQGGTGSRPTQNGRSPRPATGAPRQNAPHEQRDRRDQRDQRTSRDPWGDPRLPSPPPADPRTRPAPQFQPHDRTAGRPAQGDRTAPRPPKGDPWDQATRQVRPPRPPRDPRDER